MPRYVVRSTAKTLAVLRTCSQYWSSSSPAGPGDGADPVWHHPALLGVDNQVERAIGKGAIGVVGIYPDALVRLMAGETASQGNADLAGRLSGDARAADASTYTPSLTSLVKTISY